MITEEHWNPYTLEELEEMSRTHENPNETFPEGYLFYMGAKKYAELAAWDVQRTAKEQGNDVTLATMNCVMIFGPPSECPSDSANFSPAPGLAQQRRHVDRAPLRASCLRQRLYAHPHAIPLHGGCP